MRRFRKCSLVLAMAASLLQWSVIPSAFAGTLAADKPSRQQYIPSPSVTAQPDVGPDIRRYFNDPARGPQLSKSAITQLLRQKIKYVFIIFNENNSFDHEYGTFPGVNGIYSDGLRPRSPGNTPGFTQTYYDGTTNTNVTVQPFRVGPEYNSSAMDGAQHDHQAVAQKIDVDPATGVPRMDQFAYVEYNTYASSSSASTTANEIEGTQFAQVVMSHIDCDTIPFFWQWARRFTIFDNIFATEDTGSTPNAIAMIAGQSGETQWVKHGTTGQTYTDVNGYSGTTVGPPIVVDNEPFYGSLLDSTTVDKMPMSPTDTATTTKNEPAATAGNIASNLTFATLPLTFQGRNITGVMDQNLNPAFDLPDIQQDIPYIQHRKTKPVNWGWYQEGYDLEASDTTGTASHKFYVTHHNGAQYFGYLANTPPLRPNFHGLTDFFTDTTNKSLPQGGVFYIRGGYGNQMGLLPPINNPYTPPAEIAAIQSNKAGDDDHPDYSDRQITEAMAARVINAIASNRKIWRQCAIIIAYDESDGLYDHVPPRIRAYGPDHLPLSRGIRVPLILISPYARTHAVSHVEGDHNAVIETINAIFGLPALASLPDEAQALAMGNSPAFNQFGPPGFQQKCLGPRDINSKISDSLLSGFDPRRLMGMSPPLPASLAMIPDNVVTSLPHYGGQGCMAIGITPEDIQQGIVANPPAGFNPLPATYPILPTEESQ
ncbi:MAG: alkaline phosphatase family protein [Syntrophobacteraceae bacterium]